MTTEPTHGDILRAIGSLEGQVKSLSTALTEVERDVRELRAALHMGRGAMMTLMRVGAVLAVLAAAFAYCLDFIRQQF